MLFDTLLYEKENGIGMIDFNRPQNMNAMNNKLIQELDQILGEVASDDDIAVVIITGSERVFSAGADIKEVSNLVSPFDAHQLVTRIQTLFDKIENLPKPVIAAVSGLAVGGGCELSLACDIRIAAENALFGQPEIKIGLIPGGGGTQRLPRLIGLGRAKELLYTGDTIDAQEAHRIGLVNKVVPLESLIEETKKMAKKMMSLSGVALKITKMAVNEGINMDIRSALSYEARCFELLFSTEDRKEGITAFLEKRQPVFKNR